MSKDKVTFHLGSFCFLRLPIHSCILAQAVAGSFVASWGPFASRERFWVEAGASREVGCEPWPLKAYSLSLIQLLGLG